MKKKINILLIFAILSIVLSSIIVPYKSSATDVKLELKTNQQQVSLKKGNTINVDIYLTGGEFVYFEGYLKYDTEIFEQLNIEEAITINPELSGWELGYNEDEEENNFFSISQLSGDLTSNGLLATIKFTLKKDAEIAEIKIEDAYECDTNYNEFYFEEIATIKFEDNSTEEEPPIVEEKLYLSTEIYKIGNNDIENYEEGDKFISRIEKESTKEEFIGNLKTNGTIRIIKHDGTELGESELVGTGMTLEVTKEEEKIELQIAVMGDVSGDGIIGPQDISKIKDALLERKTLENEYKIAADLNENEVINPAELSKIKDMILEDD